MEGGGGGGSAPDEWLSVTLMPGIAEEQRRPRGEGSRAMMTFNISDWIFDISDWATKINDHVRFQD